MAITITRSGDHYLAEVTPQHAGGIPWPATNPMAAEELIREPLKRGCHQTDIGDAFYEADDAWVLRLEAGNDS